MAGCSKKSDDTPNPATNPLKVNTVTNVSKEAQPIIVGIVAPGPWTLTLSYPGTQKDFATAASTTGTGDVTLNLTFTENQVDTARAVTLTLVSGSDSKQVTITQALGVVSSKAYVNFINASLLTTSIGAYYNNALPGRILGYTTQPGASATGYDTVAFRAATATRFDFKAQPSGSAVASATPALRAGGTYSLIAYDTLRNGELRVLTLSDSLPAIPSGKAAVHFANFWAGGQQIGINTEFTRLITVDYG